MTQRTCMMLRSFQAVLRSYYMLFEEPTKHLTGCLKTKFNIGLSNCQNVGEYNLDVIRC